MKKKGDSKTIEVTSVFSGEVELGELLMRSFSLFISREIARGRTDAV